MKPSPKYLIVFFPRYSRVGARPYYFNFGLTDGFEMLPPIAPDLNPYSRRNHEG